MISQGSEQVWEWVLGWVIEQCVDQWAGDRVSGWSYVQLSNQASGCVVHGQRRG